MRKTRKSIEIIFTCRIENTKEGANENVQSRIPDIIIFNVILDVDMLSESFAKNQHARGQEGLNFGSH